MITLFGPPHTSRVHFCQFLSWYSKINCPLLFHWNEGKSRLVYAVSIEPNYSIGFRSVASSSISPNLFRFVDNLISGSGLRIKTHLHLPWKAPSLRVEEVWFLLPFTLPINSHACAQIRLVVAISPPYLLTEPVYCIFLTSLWGYRLPPSWGYTTDYWLSSFNLFAPWTPYNSHWIESSTRSECYILITKIKCPQHHLCLFGHISRNAAMVSRTPDLNLKLIYSIYAFFSFN